MQGDSKRTRCKCYFLRQRYFMAIMGGIVIINCYTMRISMSKAITLMVKRRNPMDFYNADACPVYNTSSVSIIYNPKITYDWDRTAQFIILNSFCWGYLIGQLPGGIIADQYGAKYVIGASVLGSMCFTLITPVTIQYTNGNLAAVTVLRVLLGLAQAPVYPALNAMLAQWAPRKERATISSFTYVGAAIGTVTNNALSNVLIGAAKDWSVVFYVYGSLAALCFIIWQLLFYSDPDHDPCISPEEKEYLRTKMGGISHGKKAIPWRRIFLSVPLWAAMIAQMGHDWCWFILVTHLPKYMEHVLKFNAEEAAAWSALPYVMTTFVIIISGYLCDYLINKTLFKTTTIRKLFTTLGSMGPALFLLTASYSGCNRMTTVALFTMTMYLLGTYYSGAQLSALDLSPNFAGILMAFVNSAGTFSAIVVSFAAEEVIRNETLHEWRKFFFATFLVLTVSNVVFVLFASGHEQSWNNPATNESNSEEAQPGTSN